MGYRWREIMGMSSSFLKLTHKYPYRRGESRLELVRNGL